MREPLDSGWLTQGPKVAQFETAFAARHRVQHALATTQLHHRLASALAALGIGPGDEVIVPAFTWVATANVVLYCGATPVLCDVEPRRPTTSILRTSPANGHARARRAVIAVHLFGSLRRHRGVAGGAAAAGGDRRGCRLRRGREPTSGVPAGGLGDAAAFSFHPRKSITTGEGGMVTTNDAAARRTAPTCCATTARRSPKSSATSARGPTCCRISTCSASTTA